MKRNTIKSGFTIVELLIVIVVIAILAAITIVAFNGVTARANTSSAKSSATMVAKKVEAYYVENSSYPNSRLPLTNASSSDKPWSVTGITFANIVSGTKPTNGPATIHFLPCVGVDGNNNTITTGVQVRYYNYENNQVITNTVGVCE